MTSDHRVAGSSPAGCKLIINDLRKLVLSIFDLKGALSEVEDTEQRYSVLYGKFEELWNETSIGLSEGEIIP